jgi:SAM-dependent methyltransferase
LAYQQLARYYDLLMQDMPYPSWLEFLDTCWRKFGKPGTLVELGCGTGNLTIPLAQSGIAVTGIDISPEMLAIAREKWERCRQTEALPAGGSVLFLEQDMREFQLPYRADAVISCCDSLNYILEEEQIRQIFHRVYDSLAEGGLFVFDLLTPYQYQTYADEQPFVYEEENLAYHWFCDWNEERREIEHSLTLFVRSEGADCYRRFEETHIQRAYERQWVEEELRRTGFKHVESYGDFTWEPPGGQTERMFFAAQKST